MTNSVIPDTPSKRPCMWLMSGLDPWAASGMALDIRMTANFQVHVCPVVTSITVQDLRMFDARCVEDNPLLREQLQILYETTMPRSAKIGMLGSMKVMDVVLDFLPAVALGTVILDPLTHTSSGYEILVPRARDRLKQDFFPHILLLTPNTVEAQFLTGIPIDSLDQIQRAADRLLKMGCRAVLIKGGHSPTLSAGPDKLASYYADHKQGFWIDSPKRPYECRGTGCGLSSLIAALMAQNLELGASWEQILPEAILEAYRYLDSSYQRAYIVAQGREEYDVHPRLLPAPDRSITGTWERGIVRRD